MILRELNNKLYKITLSKGITEEQFLDKQKDGLVRFLQVGYEDLPKVNENEKREFGEIFYELNGKSIVIDYDRTIKKWIDDKYKQIKNYIYSKYPQDKQNSDLVDKLYYENILKANGITNLEADIVAMVQEFYNGKSIDEVTADVANENKEAYEQLIKVGIRVAWVQHCKRELKAAIDEQREPNYPKYPL